MRSVATALALAASLSLIACGGRSTDRSGSAASRPQFSHVLDALVSGPERIAPGAAAYVAGPRGSWAGAAGVADAAASGPMPINARMRLESVSKIYTATLIVRLAQEGRLRLTDTVARWLPGLLPYGNRITIRQLLTMTSGLVDNNDLLRSPAPALARVKDAGLRARLRGLADRIDHDPDLVASPIWWVRFAAWQPLLFAPGTDEHYSNIGYDVLGLIAARAAGESLGSLYRNRILTALGLTSTAYDPQGPIAGPHARGYAIAGTTLRDATGEHVGVGADGGIVADARETATFLTALMRGRLLAQRWVAAMKGDALWRGGTATSCGSGYGWSGGGNGFKANVLVSGDGSRVAVLLLNGRVRGDGGDRRAGDALLGLYCSA